MILVTGSAGKTGLAVLRALARRNQTARALIHRAEHASIVQEIGTQEVVIGNLFDKAILSKALIGVNAVYMICPNVHPKEFEIGKAVIAAAQEAGTPKIVYHSVMYPQIEAMPHHWQKLRVEEELIESGITFTILQPASYMQNILPYWEAMTHQGKYIVPYSIDSLFSPVDLEDVADIACQVLTTAKHEGTIYSLAGGQQLSSKQMAQLVSEGLGRAVEASKQALAEWAAGAKARGMSAYAIDALTKMFTYYDQHGFAGSGVVLESLLGRPPATFSQFLSRHTK